MAPLITYKYLQYLATFIIILSHYIMTSNVYAIEDGVSTLDEQIQQLNDLSEKKPIIRLNGEKFKRFVGASSVPRNYSMIVMMTALSPHRSCHICRQAYEEFQVTANSFKAGLHFDSKRLYFGLIDYDEGSDIFASLNIQSAPCFLYFDEKGNYKRPDELNIQRLGFGADVLGRWILEKTGISVKIVRPPSYSMPIMMVLLGMAVCAILYMCRNTIGSLLNRNVWAIASVSIVLIMTSGQMWNHIRGAPLMQRGRGQNNYIHGSSSGQFVIETYLVIAMNAGIALGMVLMTDALRIGEKNDGRHKRLLARIGFILTLLSFSLLLAVFRLKSYGYPYRLLF